MTNVFFVTNRRADNPTTPHSFNGEFAVEGPAWLRFGLAEVGSGVSTLSVAPEHTDTYGAGSQAVFNVLRRKMDKHTRDTIIFIHGYNTTFEEALASGAALKSQLGKMMGGVNVVVFSWPSDGKAIPGMSYMSDRDDAEMSAQALFRAISKLRDMLHSTIKEGIACKQRIHIVAHSMGNWVLENAIQTMMKKYQYQIPRLFDTALLMAADVDSDALGLPEKLGPLTYFAGRVGVWFDPTDIALIFSDVTKLNPDRLGQEGASHPQYLHSRIEQINIKGVGKRSALRHDYYKTNKVVLYDMWQVMEGSEPNAILGREYSERSRCFYLNDREIEDVSEIPDRGSR